MVDKQGEEQENGSSDGGCPPTGVLYGCIFIDLSSIPEVELGMNQHYINSTQAPICIACMPATNMAQVNTKWP